MNDELRAIDVLKIIEARARACREDGESDMRNIINAVMCLKQQILSGKSREEILDEWREDEE